MRTAIFYHAGCVVSKAAETQLVGALDGTLYTVERVHLGEQPWRIPEAEAVGVRSVPALVLDGRVFHINYGASLEQLKEPYETVVDYPGQFTSCCQP